MKPSMLRLAVLRYCVALLDSRIVGYNVKVACTVNSCVKRFKP